MKNKTIDYYNNNAEEYSNTTLYLDLKEKYNKFTKNIKFGGKILDVGCGSGRDLIAFKSLGYDVIGIDASTKLVEIAKKNFKADVFIKEFNDIEWKQEFDGVWCMASLLHLQKEELISILNKLSISMKEGASFYASFKNGNGESFDDKDRFFSYYNKQELEKILIESKLFKDIIIEYAVDKLGRTDTQWLDIYAKKDKIKLKNDEIKKIKEKRLL